LKLKTTKDADILKGIF